MTSTKVPKSLAPSPFPCRYVDLGARSNDHHPHGRIAWRPDSCIFWQKNIIRIFQIISRKKKKNKQLKLPGPRGETWTSKKLHHTFNTTAADCTGEQGARSRWHLDRLHSPMLKHHARRFDHSAILSTVHTGLCIQNITRKPNQPKKTLSL